LQEQSRHEVLALRGATLEAILSLHRRIDVPVERVEDGPAVRPEPRLAPFPGQPAEDDETGAADDEHQKEQHHGYALGGLPVLYTESGGSGSGNGDL
jgi:hypothetical protein